MLAQLQLTNYRNISGDFKLEGANLIIAPNGSGKSNLLEAIYMLSLGKSFRPVGGLDEYIGPDQEFAKVEAKVDNTELMLVVSNGKRLQRRYYLNSKIVSQTKLIGKLPTVLFAPHTVGLVSNDPASRRTDLDDFLSQLDSEYADQLKRYSKVLKNRNALLRHIRDQNGQTKELQYWTHELSRLGSALHSLRMQFFEEILKFMQATASSLYSAESVDFKPDYQPNIAADPSEYCDTLLQKYTDNLEKEIIVGQTLYGPHKDDYSISLDGKDLRFLGSRGEQRLAVLIWKLAQHDYLFAKTNQNALLLIDDLLSELDEAHRITVAQALLADNRYQFILTSADKGDVPDLLLKKANRLRINGDY